MKTKTPIQRQEKKIRKVRAQTGNGGDYNPFGKRLASNYFLLSVGETLAKVLTFVAFAYLGRALGPERYGYLEFALASMVFFSLPVDFGLGIYGARELARNCHNPVNLLRQIATLRFIQAVFSYCLLVIFAIAFSRNPESSALLILCGLSLFMEPLLLQWFFQGRDQMHFVAIANLIRRGVFALLVLLIMNGEVPLFWIGICECVAAATAAAFCIAVLRLAIGWSPPWPWLTLADLWNHFRRYAPIGLSELAWALLWYCTPVLMGLLVSGTEMGWFGASHRVVMAAHTFVWLYFFNLLPSLTRSAMRPRQELHALLGRSLGLTTWSSIGVALGTTLLARELMGLAYGDYFVGAAKSLACLIWVIPVAMISGHFRYVLVAYGHQRVEFCCTAVSALVALGLSLLLIPPLGAVGAAVSLVTANVVNWTLACACARHYVAKITFLKQLAFPVVASGAAWTCHQAALNFGDWISATVAGTVYLTLFGIWARFEFRRSYCDLKSATMALPTAN